MRNVVLLALLVIAPSIPRPSGACEPAGDLFDLHQLDAAHATDTTPPSSVTATAEIVRTEGGGGCASSCGGDAAAIELDLAATDDATTGSRLGYRFAVASGQPPRGLWIPTETFDAPGGAFRLGFSVTEHSAFSFELEIRAVDLNGNLGPASLITIANPSGS